MPEKADPMEGPDLRADLLRALDRMDAYVGTFEGQPDYSVRELGKFVSTLRSALLKENTDAREG